MHLFSSPANLERSLPRRADKLFQTTRINNVPHVTLSNGICIPIFGIGTSHSGGYSHKALVYALGECGYALIDTAKRYGCEEFIGHAIKDVQIAREDVFIVSKLWPRDYGVEQPIKALRASLCAMQTDYLDLYMMHWPETPSWISDKQRYLDDTWHQMELLYDEGLARSIGVCNYELEDLDRLMESAVVLPHVNQIEFHPLYRNEELIEFCHDYGIVVQGYSPLAKGHLLKHSVVEEIALKHSATPAQVLIRFSIQHGVVTIPKSTNVSRVGENARALTDVHLDEDAMRRLNALNVRSKLLERSGVQAKIDGNEPDGYKLGLCGDFRDT